MKKEIREKIESIKSLRAAHQAAMESSFGGLLAGITKEIFETCPELVSITWEQYAPYFNDGDPCVFSIHDPYLSFDREFADAHEKDLYEYYDDQYQISSSTKDEELLSLAAAVDDLYRFLNEFESVSKETYGDNSKVIITRDGVRTEHSEHD